MTENPLTDLTFELRSFKCFDDSGSGPFRLKDLNFVIGRNNAGKSAIVDFFEVSVSRQKKCEPQKHGHKGTIPDFTFIRDLSEFDLRRAFRQDTSGGEINGNHWAFGSKLVGQKATYTCDVAGNGVLSELSPCPLYDGNLNQIAFRMLGSDRFQWPFNGTSVVRVSAERDVQPEAMVNSQTIQPNGSGLTNAISRQINDSNLSREIAENNILDDLNTVYLGDAQFTEIITRIDENNLWEIYLRELGKGDIRLSESGSGLKTILLIATLMHIPANRDWDKCIFAIDEPENNLHPALFRRLLEYLARKQKQLGFTLIVTTHSPIAIDWATRREDGQVIHVVHDGARAKLRVANDYASSRNILDDLDIRASDILQANGVIWVEGPSDRIYLRRWIDLFSNESLKEGIHYTIMFYGGKVLSHFSAQAPNETGELVSLLRMNRNAAVVIDSDRRLAGTTKSGRIRKPRMQVNGTKKRIKDELESIGGFVWITQGKEVENYIPISLIAKVVGQTPPQINEFDCIIDLPILSAFKGDKVKLAHTIAENLQKYDIENILDLKSQLSQLCSQIEIWNGIS